ncbi:MAG: NYN domain-containing protein [Alphaproteobacteria bacterium]|nr:NYN domain-containing protein [Alphaproteobacteria bacterium]|tara:strand:+ start:210 stop:836 length:627 start_codon:yes stop_codon:yes gene_type:complete
MFSTSEKTVVFIDGANLYATARGMDFDIDYKKLLALFREKTNLLRAYYYTVLIEDQEYSPIRPLVDWLDYNGYTLVTKPAKDFTDSKGRRRSRNSISVDLAVDMLEIADRVDHVVLISGDSGYRRAIEAVQARGARVSVISAVSNASVAVADELRRQADRFIDLAELRAEIARDRSGRPAQQEAFDNEDDYEDYEDYDDDQAVAFGDQ